MLKDTILVLKQRQGASLAQIRKRLELKNSDGKIDEAKDKMLTSTLKGLVLKGTVEKTDRGIYKLARGVPADGENDVPSRRRRAFPHGVCKTHRRYHKLRRRKGHGHRRRRSRRCHSRRRHHRRRHHRRRRR